MRRQIAWVPYSAGFRAEMPGDVTLCVEPERTRAFGTKPARGTAWRASASHWNETTRTISRYGRCEYAVQYAAAKLAMRAAECIYADATR